MLNVTHQRSTFYSKQFHNYPIGASLFFFFFIQMYFMSTSTTIRSDLQYSTSTTTSSSSSSFSVSPSLVTTTSMDIHPYHEIDIAGSIVASAFVTPPIPRQRQHHDGSASIGSPKRQRKQSWVPVSQHVLQSVSPTSILEPESPERTEEQLQETTTTTTTNPPTTTELQQQQHIVLIGGGHAHVQVLKALHRGIRPQHLHITLIDQVESASYSGMVPGCIAGHYTMADTQLQLRPLTEYSDIHFIHGTVVDIDLQQKLIHWKDYNHEFIPTPIAFDVLSIDIGSTSRGYTTCAGAIQYTIPTRPIDQLIYKLDQARQHELELQQRQQITQQVVLSKQPSDTNNGNVQQEQQHEIPRQQRRLVVIGGGIAGIELAMTITSRWKNDRVPFDTCTVIDASDTLLPHENEYARYVVQEKLQSKQIQVQYKSKVTKIDENYVYTTKSSLSPSDADENVDDDIVPIPYSLCIWSTGAGAHSLSKHLYEHRQLDCDPKSYWIRVHPTLQSMSHPYVFAAGDCCTIVQNSNDDDNNKKAIPSPPKAGVYAVRSGPILIENLTRYLESIRTATTTTSTTTILNDNTDNGMMEEKPIPTSGSDDPLTLLEYKPQDDFLKLLVCGDGTAIGFRFGIVIQGEWVFRLKDDIDQSFMKLFDVSGLTKPIYDANKASSNQVIGKYNTQQYDNNVNNRMKTDLLDPYDAASLLRRTDNDVDIGQVRLILSNMGNDTIYRNAVVDSFFKQHAMQPA